MQKENGIIKTVYKSKCKKGEKWGTGEWNWRNCTGILWACMNMQQQIPLICTIILHQVKGKNKIKSSQKKKEVKVQRAHRW